MLPVFYIVLLRFKCFDTNKFYFFLKKHKFLDKK